MIYFQYGGNLSLSGNLANQLVYEYPDKKAIQNGEQYFNVNFVTEQS